MTQVTLSPPTNFQATWPQNLEPTTWKRVAEVAYTIFSVIVFPVGLIRLAGYLIAQVATLWIIPATTAARRDDNWLASIQGNPWMQDLSHFSHIREMLVSQFGGEEISVATPDNIRLNGMVFSGQNPEKYILYCNPNASTFEHMAPLMKSIAREVGCSLLMYNPRGVVESEGAATRDGLALDVYTMFEYLVHEKGVDPNNILVYGYSLGGAYANMGAALVQEKYPESQISICNERSFDRLSSEVYSFTRQMWNLSPAIASVTSFGVKAIGWEMDSKASMDSLRGRKLIIYHKNDAVIPYNSSLYHAAKQDPHGEITRIKLRDADRRDQGVYHVRSFTQEERLLLIEELKRMLNIEIDNPIVEAAHPIRKRVHSQD